MNLATLTLGGVICRRWVHFIKTKTTSLGNTYMSNGYRMNSNGRLANPSRSAQIRARDAGALTNREAARMGLQNKRDVDDELGVGSLVGYFTNRL